MKKFLVLNAADIKRIRALKDKSPYANTKWLTEKLLKLWGLYVKQGKEIDTLTTQLGLSEKSGAKVKKFAIRARQDLYRSNVQVSKLKRDLETSEEPLVDKTILIEGRITSKSKKRP